MFHTKIPLVFVAVLVACQTTPPEDVHPPQPIQADGGQDASADTPTTDVDAGNSANVDDATAPLPGGPTDVGCGGTRAPKCDVGKKCVTDADCVTDACMYAGRCVADRSCTGHFGGDTCGVGETGASGAKHVSCCERAPLFGDLANVQLDRFLITAGRMRTFIEHTNGNVRAYVHTLPSDKWQDTWDDALVPSSLTEANDQLGSFFSKKSCHPGDYTGRTYWTAPTDTDFSDFTKDQMDEKALNCVTWQLVAAFCAWDGGRMATSAEIKNAFTNGGQYVQPWLWQPGAVQYVQPVDYSNVTPATTTFNHSFGYSYPLTNVRGNPDLDIAYHVSPPGRYPQSWNEHGHEIAGNLLEWNATGQFVFSATYSWENHGGDTVADSNWKTFQETPTEPHAPNGYYAIGGRCAR